MTGASAVTRVGVVADTHVGEWLPRLPESVLVALEGVDLIIHAGDISDRAVLDRLSWIAPVVAVRGDHDVAAGVELPRTREIDVAGYRIGVTHGRRSKWIETACGLLSLLAGRPVLLGFHRALRRRFGGVDCIVHGHLHLPIVRWIGGVLFFSPGAVHNAENAPGFAAAGFVARRYLQFRRSLPAELASPAVGILEIGHEGLRPRILPVSPRPEGRKPL